MKNSATNSNFIPAFFFGNYFYGVCAIALAIEAGLQQKELVKDPVFYILLFCVTVIYYSKAYLSTEQSAEDSNIRSAWYLKNKKSVIISQQLLVLILLIAGSLFVYYNWQNLADISPLQLVLIFIFPVTAIVYYSEPGTWLNRYNLRNIGWLKPFVIGFTWAGLVTIYPMIYNSIATERTFDPKWIMLFLFIKNFMYITLLCIMFDIKDYEMDYNMQLKTIVVKLGLKKTVYLIIIPLCVLGLGFFLGYAMTNSFHPIKILLNTIPFLLVILIAYKLHYRHSIFYYLIVIDGLMLLKALCGSVGMIYF